MPLTIKAVKDLIDYMLITNSLPKKLYSTHEADV